MSTRPRVVPLFLAGWGCPHRCCFCDQRTQTGVADRARAADVRALVARHVSGEGEGAQPVELAFYGGTFTGLPAALQEELLAAASAEREAGRVAAVRVSTHPCWLTPAHLRRLSDYRVDTVEVGVQSLDDTVLRRAGRGGSAAQTLRALFRVRAAGFRLGVQLMPGLPGADRRSDRQTAASVVAARPALARVYPTLVVRGTTLARWWRQGRYRPLELREAIRRAADQIAVLEHAGARVQRVGLHVDDALSDAVLAGPIDPAFGEMVRAELAWRRLERVLGVYRAGRLCVSVPAAERSRWAGHRRANLERAQRRYPALDVQIKSLTGLPAGEILAERAGGRLA